MKQIFHSQVEEVAKVTAYMLPKHFLKIYIYVYIYLYMVGMFKNEVKSKLTPKFVSTSS